MKKPVLSVLGALALMCGIYSPRGFANVAPLQRMHQIQTELLQSATDHQKTIEKLFTVIQKTNNKLSELRQENGRLKAQLRNLKQQHPTQGQQNWNKVKDFVKEQSRKPSTNTHGYDHMRDGK